MIKIVKTTAKHAQEIHELMAHYNLPLWSVNSIAQECEKISSISLSALDEDKVIGFINISTVLDEAQLNNIAVVQDYRKMGVASMLFAESVKKLKFCEISILMLEVRKSNINAVKFYEKNHFCKVGERKNYYENPTEDAVLYNLILNTEENFDTK